MSIEDLPRPLKITGADGLIRTSGLTDAHWAKVWRLSLKTIRSARVGDIWANHPTPPDMRQRKPGGRYAAPKARILNG